MHRVTERAAKMYKHTTVTPIIKAFGGKNGRTSIHLPQTASSRPWLVHNYETKGRWRVTHSRKGGRKEDQCSAGWNLLCLAGPASPRHLSGTSLGLCLSRDPHHLLREMNLPLRKAKPASRGNVQNRKWKMSTSSKQAEEQRENQLSVSEAPSSNGVSGYSLPLSPALSFSPCLPQ